jgi:hypothetical protein
MFPDPLLVVPDAIPSATLTVVPALLAGPGAVAILVVGAITLAAVSALVHTARSRTAASAGTPTGRSRISSSPA